MIDPLETFDGTWPYAPHFFEGSGFRHHYVDEGAGDPIVLLHGEPTWGYLYRHFIPRLVKHGRVIVPDHMGCGLSDKPGDDRYEYRLKQRVDDVDALLTKLGITSAQ